MQLPHSDVLDIAHFSGLFDNKREYKEELLSDVGQPGEE